MYISPGQRRVWTLGCGGILNDIYRVGQKSGTYMRYVDICLILALSL